MSTTIPLSQISKNDILSAGGKGANLGELAGAGLAVPPGFVLTTAAYQAFVEANGLQQQIIELAVTLPAEEAAESIRLLFMDGEMGEDVKADLIAAYEALGEGATAVRSSATAEDLPGASFAGQQESFLNVNGSQALLKAVKATWASLWTARAIAYREHVGIDHETAAMAVIVQEMAPAEVSGILFTANPATGARDELLINASFGLGEAVVSGEVTPDTFVLDGEDFSVKEAIPGTKEVKTVTSAEQGTTSVAVPEEQQGELTLSAVQLGELAALGIVVEELFGGVPQDIEWALADGAFRLLQARPITNLPPEPLRDVRWEPLRPGSIWMRRQVVEHMPGPLSPLFDELYLQEGLDRGMVEMADFMGDLSGIEIDLWQFIQPPFAATINGFAYSVASFEISWELVPLAVQVYVKALPKMIRHMVPLWRDKSLPEYQAAIKHWKDVDLEEMPDEELLRGVRELAVADAFYWFAAAVPLGLARTTDGVLDGFVRRMGAGPGSANSGAYLRGFPSKALDAQAELEAVAGKIGASDALREAVADTPASQLPQLLAGSPEGREALAGLEQYLERYGHQIYDLDFAVPTLADDPLPALLSLKTAVAHPERDARATQAQLAVEREMLTAQMANALDPLRRWMFYRVLGWAQRYGPLREEALFYVGAAWPTLRRLALELGQRLTEAGSLDKPDDVFYLRTDELAAASAAGVEGESRSELAELARERRVLRDARKRLDPPVVVPPDGRLKFGPIDMAMFEPKARAASTGSTLEGFAVSPGQVTAAASVIRSVEDFDQMAPDTILVCTTTTPAWTPLFARAKGLVTDIGGALAHGSIVAREYGIPAVMGTGDATQRIKSGQIIRVDGDAGTVTLVDELESGESEPVEIEETGAPLHKIAYGALAVGAVVGLFMWWRRRG